MTDTQPTRGDAVPRGLQVAGSWAWRFLVLAAATAVVCWALAQVSLVVIPLLLAALIASLLGPAVTWLGKHRVPRGLGVAIAMIALLTFVTGLVWLAISQLRSGYPELQEQTLSFWEELKLWLSGPPLNVSADDLNAVGREVLSAIRADAQALLSSALSVGTTFGHGVAIALLTVFASIFMLLDGRRIWAWILAFFPRTARDAVNGSGRAGWVTLGSFMRVQVLVALIDAIGIGIGAAILGVPLALPIAILVFLGAFIPVVGAVITGALAVFVALITLGPIKALIMLGIVLLVQQVESHVLQPLIMGNAVSVHPLGVVIAVTGGSIIAGIPGALFAVPIVAFINVFVTTIVSGAWHQRPDPTPEEVADLLDDAAKQRQDDAAS